MAVSVLYLAAEADPFLKVGGLGDVAGTLPGEINLAAQQSGIQLQVEVVIPYHPALHLPTSPDELGSFQVRTSAGQEEVTVYRVGSRNATYYLLSSKTISSTPSAYSSDDLMDGRKYALFSLAAVAFPAFINHTVEIIHANDWHTALALYHLKSKPEPRPKAVLSIHNLAFLGGGTSAALPAYGFQPAHEPFLPDWAEMLPLPMGISAADLIVPVSPGYAAEILTPEFGCGLEAFLNSRKTDTKGIVNGIDTTTWDPSADPYLSSNFTASTLSDRSENKSAIQKITGLQHAPEIPLLAAISRLDYQKGIDVLFEALLLLPADVPWQCILLGTGNLGLEEQAKILQEKYPEKFRALLTFDNPLAHQIYAGADIFLMPSRYEPCGISQLISQRYGALPVARATGGLKDTILPGGAATGTGYLFTKLDAATLAATILQAIKDYNNKKIWQLGQKRAMSMDVSWRSSANLHIQAYLQLLENSKHMEAV